MDYETLQGCCGVGVMFDLGNTGDYDKNDLNEVIDWCRDEQYGAIITSININQYKHWKPLLTKAGFIRALEFVNPNTKNKVSIYLKKL